MHTISTLARLESSTLIYIAGTRGQISDRLALTLAMDVAAAVLETRNDTALGQTVPAHRRGRASVTADCRNNGSDTRRDAAKPVPNGKPVRQRKHKDIVLNHVRRVAHKNGI
jgi:hypothetical protein